MKRNLSTGILALAMALLAGCTYNPFAGDNHLTGSAASTAVGAGAGVGIVALFRGSPAALTAGGVAGGLVGYYVSTLRFDSGGIIQGGGQVYTVGDYVGIILPGDVLFQPNSAEFTQQAKPILDSTATVLKRYPDNNILISGNTTGFGRPRWEKSLSLQRAQKVAAYLWMAGVSQFRSDGMRLRKLNYVGYGDYFSIATHSENSHLRLNNHIQITSYPNDCDMQLDKRHVALYNVGGMDDSAIDRAPADQRCGNDKNCYDLA